MTILVSFLFFWTSQRPLTLLTTKYYSYDLSVATVSMVMLWPGCAHISQIGSNTSEWRMIVHLRTSWPVVFQEQGFVLGRILGSMYSAPIADVIKLHGMGFPFFDFCECSLIVNSMASLTTLFRRCQATLQRQR